MSTTISSTEVAEQIEASQIAESEASSEAELLEETSTEEKNSEKVTTKPSSEAEPESKEKESVEEADDGSDEGPEVSESQKPSGRTRNRIQKLRARTEALEREIEVLRAGSDKNQEPKNEQVGDAKGRPQFDDFETEEDYQDALADWRVEQKLAERERKVASEKLASEFENRVQAHREKSAEFAKQHVDFKEVIESVSDIVLTPVIQDAILKNGPEFMYELAKNPEELERISELSAFEAAYALGRIEERIAARAAKPKEEKKIQSKAPQPITPTRSGAGTGSHKTIYDEGLSFSDYEKLRNTQLKEVR